MTIIVRKAFVLSETNVKAITSNIINFRCQIKSKFFFISFLFTSGPAGTLQCPASRDLVKSQGNLGLVKNLHAQVLFNS